MADSSVTYQLVSITEAARVLAVSESTVRRLVKAGRLESEQVQRPQGHVWLVKVPAPSSDQLGQPPDQIAASGATPSTEPSTSTPVEAMTALVQATVATVLGPLVVELGASRQTIERQADQLVQQAEVIGRVTAERDALVSQIALQTAAPEERQSVTDGVTLWRRFWPLALGLVVIMIVTALLVWPR